MKTLRPTDINENEFEDRIKCRVEFYCDGEVFGEFDSPAFTRALDDTLTRFMSAWRDARRTISRRQRDNLPFELPILADGFGRPSKRVRIGRATIFRLRQRKADETP